MHKNYRRRIPKTTSKRHGPHWSYMYSTKEYRKQKSSERRAQEREYIHHERWDDLPTRYPQNIFWDYW